MTNLLPSSSRRKRELILLNKIRSEKGNITADTIEIQKTIREYYEQLEKPKPT